MNFEWSETKRRENIRKHGIGFVDVARVFDGPARTYEDDRFPYLEQRFVTIGLLHDIVILIAHTETDETIRIISARKAGRRVATEFFARFAD